MSLANVMDYSTISIKKDTKQKLDELGKKNDSYDDVINRLIDGDEAGQGVKVR